ncbi:MAG: hypothetical protein WDN67_01610 [Candidatus Moraniibacteriota bacterium]
MPNLFIKTEDEIECLRESAARLAGVLARVIEEARPGVSTLALDRLAETLIRAEGGSPNLQRLPIGWPHALSW